MLNNAIACNTENVPQRLQGASILLQIGAAFMKWCNCYKGTEKDIDQKSPIRKFDTNMSVR